MKKGAPIQQSTEFNPTPVECCTHLDFALPGEHRKNQIALGREANDVNQNFLLRKVADSNAPVRGDDFVYYGADV